MSRYIYCPRCNHSSGNHRNGRSACRVRVSEWGERRRECGCKVTRRELEEAVPKCKRCAGSGVEPLDPASEAAQPAPSERLAAECKECGDCFDPGVKAKNRDICSKCDPESDGAYVDPWDALTPGERYKYINRAWFGERHPYRLNHDKCEITYETALKVAQLMARDDAKKAPEK